MSEGFVPRRGVNLSHWFSQYGDPSSRRTVAPADLRGIRAAGMDHVRLPVDPEFLRNFDSGTYEADTLAEIDAALTEIDAAGLCVVVDLHPSPDFKARMAVSPDLLDRLASTWSTLAGRWAQRLGPERLAFELLNEPVLDDVDRWAETSNRLLRRVRDVAPEHGVVLCGAAWSSADDLCALPPPVFDRLIYTFHFYEPHVFTHQGAGWGKSEWEPVRGIGYPPSPNEAERIEEPSAHEAVRCYVDEGWGARRVDEWVARAAAWGARHGVPIWCGEFGVYAAFSPPASRVRWLRDAREAFERHGVGWTTWDYRGGFAMVRSKPEPGGAPEFDPGVLDALGLGREG